LVISADVAIVAVERGSANADTAATDVPICAGIIVIAGKAVESVDATYCRVAGVVGAGVVIIARIGGSGDTCAAIAMVA
jgi:hypothetical protein